jgi:hypothetical protein
VNLLYIDESGKSGIRDPNQPYFVLSGIVVDDSKWRQIESHLEKEIESIVPRKLRPAGWELHMADIEAGKGHFKAMRRADRRALVEAVVSTIEKFDLTLLIMIVDKAQLSKRRRQSALGADHWAYEFMVERYQHLLRRRRAIGIVVGDEQKGAEALSRTDHALWRRSGTSALKKVDRVLETVFFLPSHYSLMLQMADVVAWWANRAMRLAAKGSPEPAVWTRLTAHVDTHANGKVVGYKVWPP